MDTTPRADHPVGSDRPIATAPRARGRRDPIRTCVGCRRRLAPSVMVRLTLADDGTVAVGRRAPGRGAWLCGPECFAAARRRRGFERAWRRPVPVETLEAIGQLISDVFESTAAQMREWTAAGTTPAGRPPTKG